MSVDHTYVYVIDQPSNSQGGKGGNKNEITVTNEPAFRQTIRQYQIANIFRYIGSFARAYQIAPEKEEVQSKKRFVQIFDPPAEEYIEEIRTTFLGTSQTFQVPGEYSSIKVFQGIPQQLYSALVRQAYDEAEGILSGFSNTVTQIAKRSEGVSPGEPGYYFLTRTEQFLSINLLRKDGTILKVNVSSRLLTRIYRTIIYSTIFSLESNLVLYVVI